MSSATAESSEATNGLVDHEVEKENMPAPGQPSGGLQKKPLNGPKIFTTVLHSTELSLQVELTIFATSLDPRFTRRQSQALNSSRTPGSTTAPHPSTPLSTIPPTPSSTGGPSVKKQKMLLDCRDLHEFESKLIATTASPLYLESVDSLHDAQKVLEILKHPLHQSKPPSPKTRKRTIAELAADEALAAEEERFMLIMDERLAPASSNAAAGAKSAAADGQSGAASFEPRFSRFKALENIKMQHEEKAKREHEKKMQQDHAKRQQQEQMERDRRRELEEKAVQERAMREMHARQQIHQAKLVAQAQQQQQQQIAAQNLHAHPQQNGIMPSTQQQQQQMLQASQGQHSSPILRHQTPHGSSPLVGQMGVNHPSQSVPMNITSSSQGAGSPGRPPSALQHSHPGVAAAMAQQISQRSSQQALSRSGTPQMSHGTPSMQQATPVMRHHVTPTPRMSHASPVGSAIAQTPVMTHNMMGTPHMNGVQLTPQQHRAMLVRQQQQQALHQQQQQRHSSPNSQMSPAAAQHLAQTQAQNAIQAQPSQQQFQQQMYQQQMQRQTQQQMANLQAQHQGAQQQGMQLLPNGNINPSAKPSPQQQHLMQQRYHHLVGQLRQRHGADVPPALLQQARATAIQAVQGALTPQQMQQMEQRQMMQQAQMAQMAQAQAQAQAQNGGGMMGGMNELGGGLQGHGRGM